jgi:hypothetical protein
MALSRSYYMDNAAIYRIRVYGSVSQRWASDYCAMKSSMTRGPDGATRTELVGNVMDQAALVAILNWLYELGNAILSVERIAEGENAETC